ncbi:MAG: hypothetical protein H6920_00580 [Sphingomonadaceae bacterium]|jgi:hypothetical protein|nr:hypothetical protein [Sphingomonadaceae bacterium]MCP5384794.1 hypothetical protein [Altererythrobacter sp.]MCP5390110.1 hypothetical protein [Sphingomonadaceae bacterium]MCP5392557.1 hypothetical protein [Sphingomonadaceae bacterium]
MSFLHSEVTRNFLIGFAAGALILFAQTGPELFGSPVPEAAAKAAE